MFMILPLALLALLQPAPLSAPTAQKRLVENDTDRIVLTDGTEVKARVLYEDDEVVVVRQGNRKEREYPRAEVAEIHSVERSMAQLLDRVSALRGTDDMDALAEVVAFADANGLPHEARLVRLYMLTLDPESEVAWAGLDARKGSKGWQLKDDKSWRSFDEYLEAHQSWKDRFELRSSHFVLESDLPLADNLRTLLTLEEFYRVFYEAMTAALRIYHFDELPLIQITKDKSQCPAPPVPRDAWFSVLYNTLNVYVPEEVDTRLIVHELTQGMLHNAFNNTLRKDGQVAPWVRRGLSEWFAGGVKEGALHLEIDLEQPDTALFERHAQAEQPIPLKQLLVMSPMEFEAGPKAELGAAEAYTLLVFLARGADRKYRDGLLQFVLASYQGKGSPSHFKKLVSEDLDALEAEWTAWARLQAGG